MAKRETDWERMATEINALLQAKLNQPLCGADVLWMSLVLQRHRGDRYAAITLEDIYSQREAKNGSP
jgi:hypothetical protein